MSNKDLYSLFSIDDILDLGQAIERVIALPIKERNTVYDKLIKLNGNDLSRDFFQEIYEEELAQRSQSKQDFTPNSVGVLLSRLTGVQSGTIYEPTAGNGSLLIANWWHRKTASENFNPEEHPVDCWELSDRSIPLLLLNLSIRGIIGTVNHGDVLTKETKQIYKLTREDQSRFSLISKQA